MTNKNVYVIAGPNGSGKTTFASRFLPGYVKCPNFINADLIAQGLSPFAPRTAAMKAGKLVLGQIYEFARGGHDFAFESTLAGKSYANLFRSLKTKGYKLHLYFLWIPHAELAIERIKGRVARGGHHVSAQDAKRRFQRSIRNFFELYQPLLNIWMLFDNAGPVPILVARTKNSHVDILDPELFSKMQASAR